MSRLITRIITTALLLSMHSAHAYLGPGVGGGVIATIIAFVFAVFVALFGIIYYPIKRFITNRKKKKDK